MTTEPANDTPEQDDIFKKNPENEWREFFSTAFWAIAVALVIRTFLFEPFNIPSGSMFPTLLVGDYLFVEKYSYGYSRYSSPIDLLPDFSGRLLGKAPERGDVIVFRLPREPSRPM